MDLENIMRVMNIPECYAHTLSQLYVILEKESDVINNLRESQDVDSLYITKNSSSAAVVYVLLIVASVSYDVQSG